MESGVLWNQCQPFVEMYTIYTVFGMQLQVFGDQGENCASIKPSGFRSKNSQVPFTFWSVNFVETEWFQRLLNICKLPQSFSRHQVHWPEKFWEIFSPRMLSDTDWKSWLTQKSNRRKSIVLVRRVMLKKKGYTF